MKKILMVLAGLFLVFEIVYNSRWDYLRCLWHGFTPAFSLP